MKAALPDLAPGANPPVNSFEAGLFLAFVPVALYLPIFSLAEKV